MTLKKIGVTNYFAGSDGHIYNRFFKRLSGTKHTKGYLRVSLMINGTKQYKYIHRLIAETFIDNIFDKPTVNHKNGRKDDNRVNNLEWATFSENNKHAHDSGIQPKTRKWAPRCRTRK